MTRNLKSLKPIIKTVVANRKEKRYEKKIAESQKKLAETTLVPGYTNIYA